MRPVRHPLTWVRQERGWSLQDLVTLVAEVARAQGVNMAAGREKAWRWENRGVRCCAAAVPEMRRGGYGRIVNVTSHLGSLSSMGGTNVSYRVSKAALNALTRVLAAELEGTGILVNACSPGRTRTRMAYGETDRTPEEAADTPVWLATLPEGDSTTGGLFYERKPLPW